MAARERQYWLFLINEDHLRNCNMTIKIINIRRKEGILTALLQVNGMYFEGQGGSENAALDAASAQVLEIMGYDLADVPSSGLDYPDRRTSSVKPTIVPSRTVYLYEDE